MADKERIQELVYAQRERFVGLAHDIHEHAEVGYCEDYAADRLTDFLAGEGFAVSRGVYGMQTAFTATLGSGPLHVVFCAEYDALPPDCLFDRSKPPELVEVWLSPERKDSPLLHACGHNIIAGAAVAAAVSLKSIAEQAGLKVSVFGTPAEELYGLPEPADGRLAPGKTEFLKAGGFQGVHAVMMIHPFPTPWSVFLPTVGYPRLRARFSQAVAGGSGVDYSALKALEAALKRAVASFHEKPSLFVGRAEGPNEGAGADFAWVGSWGAGSEPARAAVRRCFEETAAAAGVSVAVSEYARDADMRHDPLLSAAFRRNAQVLGRIRERDKSVKAEIRKILPLYARLIYRVFPRFISSPGLFLNKFPVKVIYGTDLASVSQAVPAIHPFVGIGGLGTPHSLEFAAQADSEEAYRAMIDGSIALAWTAYDAATEPALRDYLLKA